VQGKKKRHEFGFPTLVSQERIGALVTWRQRLCYRLLPRFALGLGARSSRKNSSPACRRRLEKLSAQAGGIVRIRSASFHLRFSVRFRLLRGIEYVDHLHEHFVNPVSIVSCDYVLPQKPGYSIQVRPETLEQFVYPTAKYGETCRETLFICV
jgi:hypothetical protein